MGYYDVDYVGYKVERKNTSGGWHFLGGNLDLGGAKGKEPKRFLK